ncbi:MAG TPA: iron-containing alcohol dehydrogenase, partial [Firmicutes bacterium]|nr:iron-containing alcohol dehydrogenase [Bacillota bacterium]
LMGVPNSGRGGMWVVHPIEHAITGLKDEVAHGSGIAAVLPAYLEFLGKEKPAKVIQLAERIFDAPEDESDDNKKGICVEGFRSFIEEIGLSPNLSGLGIKEEDLEQIADNILGVSGFPWPGMDRTGFIAFMKTAL